MKKTDSWIEILLETPKSYSEALGYLCTALADYGACGAILDEDTADEKPSAGQVCQACGQFARTRVYFPAAGHTVEEILSLVERTTRQTKEIYPQIDVRALRAHTIGTGNWEEGWKAYFVPSRVSQRIFVAPPWNIPEVPEGSILILIEPGRAFGTGQHPSTALCLEFLDDIARDQGGISDSFLDVGYGSGILCIAAQKLGAKTIIGIDIDQDTAGDALKNFRYNKVNNQIKLVNGPLECVRKRFDMVCANLDLGLLQQSVHLIAERVENQGGVILSGILEEEALGISQIYQGAGLHKEGEKVKGEWKALYMRRKGKGEEKKDMRR